GHPLAPLWAHAAPSTLASPRQRSASASITASAHPTGQSWHDVGGGSLRYCPSPRSDSRPRIRPTSGATRIHHDRLRHNSPTAPPRVTPASPRNRLPGPAPTRRYELTIASRTPTRLLCVCVTDRLRRRASFQCP